MLNLFFGNWISAATTVLVIGMLVFMGRSHANRANIRKWGRRIGLFIVAGTAVSGLSATRDAYMMTGALFSASGMQSTVCSIAGGLIFLTGLVCIFLKNQAHRRRGFTLISALFVIQVLTVEISRTIMLVRGSI